ncbi:MAG: protein kinase domain-containing protein [Gemmatimonadaceae bacterium]
MDAVLRASLACDADYRDTFVREACEGDEALRREVSALLAAHDGMSDSFLERPVIEAIGAPSPPMIPPNERIAQLLADALAGRYAIEHEIARGGMATVFLARDLRHDRRVAIKVMRDEVAAAVGAARFLEEIRVTALLQHPNILPLFDSGSVAGLLWYAMPFVEGETLRSRLKRESRLPVPEATRITREVADALEHAHARGILHRDIKPENILLRDGHALVADFGIALALEHAGGERLTKTGLTLGTPQYMAPEQASGERTLDGRVDVYALGAVLYEMLAAEPPFTSASRQAVLLRILHEAPTTLATRRPDVSASLDGIVRQALAKRPADRFSTAGAFAAALDAPDRLATSPSAAEFRAKVNEPPPKRSGVTMRAAALLGIGGIGLGLAGGFALARSPSSPGSPSVPRPAVPWTPNFHLVSARGGRVDGLSLIVVDRSGRTLRDIDANRPWTPRFSPDGGRVVYGAYGVGRGSSDLWLTDLETGTTKRLTDDDGDSNDPQWSPDGGTLAYSVNAPEGKDVVTRKIEGGEARVVMSRPGLQFPSDWPRKGGALVITEDGPRQRDILVQPTDGSAARIYVATKADELTARVSPDGKWIAYTSDESGHAEVYLDSYPTPNQRVMISAGDGKDPVWRGDGRELYYWRDDRLMAVPVGPTSSRATPEIGTPAVLFRASYSSSLNTMYDVTSDGQRFVLVVHQ